MRRDAIRSQPHVAAGILIIGAIAHFLLCIPLYGRRGFPEIAPIWLAMMWVFVVPVIVSAAFEPWGRTRIGHLVRFTIAASFVVSWATVTSVPSHRSAGDALIELPLYAIAVGVVLLLVECVSRLGWRAVRRFVGSGEPVTHARFVRFVAAAVIAAGALMPPAYHEYRRRGAMAGGAALAREHWRRGKPEWPMPSAAWDALPEARTEQIVQSWLDETADPVSGLTITRGWPGWYARVRERAYRAETFALYTATGKPPADFMLLGDAND